MQNDLEYVGHMCRLWSFKADFIIKDLPSMLILIVAYQIINDSLCCPSKYNWCLCSFIGELYILHLTILINLSAIYIILHNILCIKLNRSYYMIMKTSSGHSTHASVLIKVFGCRVSGNFDIYWVFSFNFLTIPSYKRFDWGFDTYPCSAEKAKDGELLLVRKNILFFV